MNTMLDLLGATIIGGIIFLLIFNLNTYSARNQYSSDSDLTLQRNAKTLASIIENDVRKVGFHYNGLAITTAQPQKFSFYSDIDSNGTVDNVTLTISDSTILTETPNPSDKIYYRIINGDTLKGASLGLTKLLFSYKNEFGKVTTALDSIKYIEAQFWMASPAKIDSDYAKTFWEITVNPRNL